VITNQELSNETLISSIIIGESKGNCIWIKFNRN